MATVGDVRVKISANAAKLQGALRKVGATMKKFGQAAARAGKVVVAAFVAIGAAALKSATTIESAFRTIAVGTGATGENLRRLKQDFSAVFTGVPDSAQTVAGALANVNTLFGVTGKEAQTLTKQILDFSRLTGGEGSQNALQFGRAMKQFGINAKDSTDLLDTFFRITQETGISFERLTRDLREFGPVLKLANIGADEGARIIANLSKEGINFTRVSPALRQGFINFGKAGLDARTELQKYIKRVKEAGTDQEATTILTEKFGTEVGRLAIAIRKGAFALDDETKALDRNRGAIAKTEEETRTFGDEIGVMRNKIVIALKPVGDAFLALFRAILPAITNFITVAGQKMPAAVIRAFEVFAALISTVGPSFIGAFNAITIAFKGVALAAVAVALGIRGAILAVKQWTGASAESIARSQTAFDDVAKVFDTLTQSIVQDASEIANAQQNADKLADAVAKVGREYEQNVIKNTKAAADETVKVKEKTDEVKVATQELKEPADQFIGTVKIAGQTIDIQLNNKLEVTKQKLIDIRELAKQAAQAMGGG